MHAGELRSAVARVVKLLESSGVATAIRDYRASPEENRAVAAARLSHAGAVITAASDSLGRSELNVMRALHLDKLATTEYWETLLEPGGDARESAAAFVHLHSRVMFASSHVPSMLSLLNGVRPEPAAVLPQLNSGEGRLVIRLTDAGERATDPRPHCAYHRRS